MYRRWWLLGLLLCFALLVACTPPAVPSPPVAGASSAPPTLAPAPTRVPDPTATPRAAEPASTPAPTEPVPTDGPSPVATTVALESTPFFDCAIHPGLERCAGSPLPIGGRLAFVDSSCVLRVLDLAAGTAWQSQLVAGSPPTPAEQCWVGSWSPDGKYLRTRSSTSYTDPGFDYLVYRWDGQEIQQLPGDPLLVWSEQSMLEQYSDDGRVRSADGQEAWFDPSTDTPAVHIKSSSASATTNFPIAGPPDQIHALHRWLAEGRRLLAEKSFASSGAMLSGGWLYTIDPRTGAVHDLGIRSHATRHTYQINPVSDEVMAVVATQIEGAPELVGCGLVEVNVVSETRRCLSTDGADTPVWSPNGSLLAYFARDPNTSDRGWIEIVRPGQSEPIAVRQDLPGTRSGVLTWIGNEYLLYLQNHYQYRGDEREYATVHLLAADGRFERELATELAPVNCYPDCFWSNRSAYHP